MQPVLVKGKLISTGKKAARGESDRPLEAADHGSAWMPVAQPGLFQETAFWECFYLVKKCSPNEGLPWGPRAWPQ